MPRRNGHPDNCACCAGLSPQTPQPVSNRPAQPEIEYRSGTYASFVASMRAGLSDASRPPLAGLRTRDSDDFSLAFLDAAAVGLDVLTFYQERIANEHYLRTAGERQSVVELARLIGYEPAPGVAASTHLGFRFQQAPGVRFDPVTISTGTRVQSVPGPGEMPQVFETLHDFEARVEWGGIRVQRTMPWRPEHGDHDLYLKGVDHSLEAGDVILIVGKSRQEDGGSERWDVRTLASVEPDGDAGRTRLTWADPLGHPLPPMSPASEAVQVFVFRQRASLFGHNATEPKLFDNENAALEALINSPGTTGASWKNYALPSGLIDLDTAYPKIQSGSWMVLLSGDANLGSPSLPGYAELYRARRVLQRSQSRFGISARFTQVVPDTLENLTRFGLKQTQVLAQSVELPVSAREITAPVFGAHLALDQHVEDLQSGQALTVSGKAQRIKVAPGIAGLVVDTDDEDRSLDEGDSLVLLAAPESRRHGLWQALLPHELPLALEADQQLRFVVRDRDGATGELAVRGTDVVLDRPAEEDPLLSEVVFIDTVPDSVVHDRDRTYLALAASLKGVYARSTAQVDFNVVPASHGETINEILGNGDARVADQRFTLAQGPMTYVSAGTPNGRQTSLEVRVNDVRWDAVPTLFGQSDQSRSYEIAHFDDGRTVLLFGDGAEGARLPSGNTNVRARYRKGLGASGNLATGQISTLLTRPLGIEGASNPEPAAGGQDPEALDDARSNAPLTVLTLDRAVSVDDYRDFARSYAGIAKAHAAWVPAGPARGVFLTVAGVDGAAVDPASTTMKNLIASLRRYGDPMMPLRAASYTRASFVMRMTVKVDPRYEAALVLEAVRDSLNYLFGFAQRDFGQHAAQDEATAFAHRVDGVVAVRVLAFHKVDAAGGLAHIIPAASPQISLHQPPDPAEMLTLDPSRLHLEVMA